MIVYRPGSDWYPHSRTMFERIKQLWKKSLPSEPQDGPVSRWASSQFLRHRLGDSGNYVIEGQLHERQFRAECGPSRRPYISGMEFRARVDLALPPKGKVVLMSRAVASSLRRLEAQDVLPRGLEEEVGWITALKEAKWAGPEDTFWNAYVVRTDEPELARRWLNNEAISFLTLGDSEVAARVPMAVALMRGKCYLRLEVNPHAEEADTLLALELLEQLVDRALSLAGRQSHSA